MPWTFYNANGQRLSSAATNISVLDIDGATDIGAAIVDADLFIIDDGAGGTNRKTAASRLKTYVEDAAGEVPIANLNIDGGTDIGAAIVDADLFIIDDGAGGTNRKTAASRIKTYVGKTSLLTGTTAVNANTVTSIAIKDAAESHSFYVYSAYSTGGDIYQGAYISATETVAAISHVRIGRADADAGGADNFYLVNGTGGSITYVYEVVEI